MARQIDFAAARDVQHPFTLQDAAGIFGGPHPQLGRVDIIDHYDVRALALRLGTRGGKVIMGLGCEGDDIAWSPGIPMYGTDDIRIDAEGKGIGNGGFAELLGAEVTRSVVGHGGVGDKYIRRSVQSLQAGREHIPCGEDIQTAYSRRGLFMGGSGNQ